MLSALLRSRASAPELLSFTDDLQRTTTQRLVWAILGSALAIWFVLGTSDLRLLSGRFFALGGALAVWGFTALRLANQRTLAAQAGWQVGLAILIGAGVWLYPHSFIRLYFALLPLVATITAGWQGGALAEAVVVGLMGLLSVHGALPPMTAGENIQVVVASGLLGVLTWAGTEPFYSVTLWAIYYAEQASRALEQARSRQEELKQIGEDLLTANQELARLGDRHKALEQLAEQGRQAKAEFVANVSHELRAPLNMIIGYTDMIVRSPRAYGARLPAALLADIAVIQRNATHLSHLVDDVLDLSQIEAGRMALSRELCSPGEIIQAAVSAVTPLFAAKHLTLDTEVAGDLPKMLCDQTRVRQILINLLSNAGRFTQAGGVRIRAWREGDDICLCVTDTGPGISPEDQKRLFEPFQQLDNSIRREHSGSGLGLSICKRFVEMHGGRIWLQSEPGQGTSISFSLPVEGRVEASLRPIEPAHRWVNAYASREPRMRRFRAPLPAVLPRFVLADRQQALQRLFSRYVENASIAVVPSLTEALQEIRRSPARALVVNTPSVLSPGEQADLWRRLARLPYRTPAIACWLPGRDEAIHELGVVDYLVKPATGDQLLAAIRKARPDARSVLLADDDPDLLQLFARILSSASEGYLVWRASTGVQALEIMRERLPDLVVLDLMLPDEDGFTILQQRKSEPSIRDIPVIVLSARDPIQETAVAGSVLVSREGGMSARELLDLVAAVTEVLAPQDGSNRPTSPRSAPE